MKKRKAITKVEIIELYPGGFEEANNAAAFNLPGCPEKEFVLGELLLPLEKTPLFGE